MKKKKTYMDFKKLLRSAAVEKAPDGFTQKVMQKIDPDYSEKLTSGFLPYLLWIGVGLLLALGYNIYQSWGTQIQSDYFYFLLEDITTFVQSFNFSPKKLFIYIIPVLAIILGNIIYENLKMEKYLP